MIGFTNGTTTTYDLTDAEGSVLTSLSSSAVLGEQIYGPYGNQRYTQGSMGTDKGYTGQFQDKEDVYGIDTKSRTSCYTYQLAEQYQVGQPRALHTRHSDLCWTFYKDNK